MIYDAMIPTSVTLYFDATRTFASFGRKKNYLIVEIVVVLADQFRIYIFSMN